MNAEPLLDDSKIAEHLRQAARCSAWNGILGMMSATIPPQHLKQCQDAVKSINGLPHLFSSGSLGVHIDNPAKLLTETSGRLSKGK